MRDVEVTKMYVRYREGLPDTEMMCYAVLGFQKLGVVIQPFEWVDDVASLNDLGPRVGIVGYVGDVWAGLRRIKRPIPPALDYPDALRSALGRNVRRGTIDDVRRLTQRAFVKPVETKAFTGFVYQPDAASMLRIVRLPDDMPVWISDVVEFVSEWRVHVLYRKVIACQPYKGDFWVHPSMSAIVESVKLMTRRAPHAYALDFGVTKEGATLLVEGNDGFSFGHYGLTPVSYARMLAARWHEMASARSAQK